MEAAKRWGLTPDEWRGLSAGAKYEIMAFCRAEDTMRAWGGLDRKERGAAIAAWREAKAKE